jgi:hypothetical protein
MANPEQLPPPMTIPSKVTIKKTKTPQDDIEVYAEVLADGTVNDKTVQGDTSFRPEGALSDGKGGNTFFRTPGFSYEKKTGGMEIITKLSGPVEIKGTIKIQTVYGPDAKATMRSGYGRGTTTEDESAGNTSLGFHESCHRSDFLNYLKTTALPAFGGKVGMSRQLYDQSVATFAKAVAKYFTDMDQDSVRRTDEVGYTMSLYKAKGPRP